MKVGIIGAMREDIDLLKQDLEKPELTECGGREFYSGKLYGKDAVIVYSRCGKVSAAIAATSLIERFDVEMLIYTGLAGAVSQSLSVGDLVVASELVQYDMDASAIPGFERYEIPFLGASRFFVSDEMLELACRSAEDYIENRLRSDILQDILDEFGITQPKVVSGLVGSADRFVANSEEVSLLASELPGLQCVEMEGAAMAQVCYEYDLPFAVLRAISDRAGRSAGIDFMRFVSAFASRFARGMVIRLVEEI